jgi:predicted metallo-beta-lactamase superfamily hydrolase
MSEKDYLAKMLEIQKGFQVKYDYDPRVYELASAVMTEAGETWAISGGKWWKNYIKEAPPHGKLNRSQANKAIKLIQKKNEVKIKEEIIDQLHFWLCEALEMGMDSKEIFTAYCSKMGVNQSRQETGY